MFFSPPPAPKEPAPKRQPSVAVQTEPVVKAVRPPPKVFYDPGAPKAYRANVPKTKFSHTDQNVQVDLPKPVLKPSKLVIFLPCALVVYFR